MTLNTKLASGDPENGSQRVMEALDQIDWYRRCLADVVDRRPVRGLDEAKLGYDRAMEVLRHV